MILGNVMTISGLMADAVSELLQLAREQLWATLTAPLPPGANPYHPYREYDWRIMNDDPAYDLFN